MPQYHRFLLGRIAGIAIGFLLLGTSPSNADVAADCAQAADPELRISACSAVIVEASLRKNKRAGEDLGTLYRRRGSAYLDTGKFAEAVADFSQAVSLKPNYALAYYERGKALVAMGERERARADYDTAIKHDPHPWPAIVSRGYLRLIEGDINGAINDYSRAIEIEPNNAIAFNNRGLAWRKLGDLTNALADYSTAISADPRYALAFANRGHVHEALGDRDKARADFTMALSFDPTLPSAAAGLRRVGTDAVVMAESNHIVEEGRTRVEVNCSPCHAVGTDNKSPNDKAPAFRAIHNRYPMLTLRDPISRGLAYPHRDMPKFNFSGDEIDAIIAYISTLPSGN